MHATVETSVLPTYTKFHDNGGTQSNVHTTVETSVHPTYTKFHKNLVPKIIVNSDQIK